MLTGLETLIGVTLALMNVAAGLVLAYSQFRFYNSFRKTSWIWVKFGMGMMGLYWAGLYVYITLYTLGFFAPPDAVWFGRIFIRPALTLTLSFAAAGAMMRWQSIPKKGE